MSININEKYHLMNKSLNNPLYYQKKQLNNKNQGKLKFNPKNLNIKKENMRRKLDHILNLLNTKNKKKLNISKQNITINEMNNVKTNNLISKEKKSNNKSIKNLKLDSSHKKNLKHKSCSVEIFPNKRKKFIYYRNNDIPQKTNILTSNQENLKKEKLNNIISRINKKKDKKEINNISFNEDKICNVNSKFFKNGNKILEKDKSAENLNTENLNKNYFPVEIKENLTSISINGTENIHKFQENYKSNKTNNYSTTQLTVKDENSFNQKNFDKEALICDSFDNKNNINYNYRTNNNYNYNKKRFGYNHNLRNNLIKKIKIKYGSNKNFDIKLNIASKNKIKNKRKEKLMNLIENYDKKNKFIKGLKSYFRHWKHVKDEKKIKANKLKKYKKDRNIRINNIVYAPDCLDCLFEIVDVNENFE